MKTQLTPTQRVEKLKAQYSSDLCGNGDLFNALDEFAAELEASQSTADVRSGQILELRQQLAAKERECEDLTFKMVVMADCEDTLAAYESIAKLSKENTDLRKDKERLDWLASATHLQSSRVDALCRDFTKIYNWFERLPELYRYAIDQAMQKGDTKS